MHVDNHQTTQTQLIFLACEVVQRLSYLGKPWNKLPVIRWMQEILGEISCSFDPTWCDPLPFVMDSESSKSVNSGMLLSDQKRSLMTQTSLKVCHSYLQLMRICHQLVTLYTHLLNLSHYQSTSSLVLLLQKHPSPTSVANSEFIEGGGENWCIQIAHAKLLSMPTNSIESCLHKLTTEHFRKLSAGIILWARFFLSSVAFNSCWQAHLYTLSGRGALVDPSLYTLYKGVDVPPAWIRLLTPYSPPLNNHQSFPKHLSLILYWLNCHWLSPRHQTPLPSWKN